MTKKQLASYVFKDAEGKFVIMQWPNIPLMGWLVFKIAAVISKDQSLDTTLNGLGTTFLLGWATLEITSGSNLFRKLLGLTVFIATINHYI
jgi:hypothetical protein